MSLVRLYGLVHHTVMRRHGFDVSDLIELAVMPGPGATEHLTKVYDWRYSHILSQARGLAGSGFAIITVAILPLIQPDVDNPISRASMITALSGALLLVILGSARFIYAARVHREFVAAQALLAELIGIRPFIRLYRSTP